MATDLVTDLVKVLADQPDMIAEDVLCERMGALSHEADQGHVDERVDPLRLAEAMVAAADDAVMAALPATGGSTDAWRTPWRVLTALAGVLPYPVAEAASEAITQLRATAAGRPLPAAPPGPEVTGTVLWSRDRYGSRFAVAAPITTADQPVQWYLWDIDACGHQAFTVHSGFYPTSEAAFAAWQDGVGQIASAGAALDSIDDPWLLADLLPAEQRFMRSGGESVEQFAEYHRGKRLAEVVKWAMPRPEIPERGGLTAATAAVEFTAWLRSRGGDQQELPQELDELATELAESWCNNDIDALYGTCSPHRVALCVPHLRNYYEDEFADQLLALLPDWTRWLAMRNATAPELADRCLPYAHGQPHPRIGTDDREVDYLARVVE